MTVAAIEQRGHLMAKRKRSTHRKRSGASTRPISPITFMDPEGMRAIERAGRDLWEQMVAEARRDQFPYNLER